MKQLFIPLTEPLGAIWLLMALGVVWLLLRRQWRSALWLGIPTALVFLLGSTSIAESLVAAEERPWASGLGPPSSVLRLPSSDAPAADAPTADAVVALGGGDRISRHDILGFAISDGGSRMLTAIELVRSGKARTLVLGGGWPMPDEPVGRRTEDRGPKTDHGPRTTDYGTTEDGGRNAALPSMGVLQDWVARWGLVSGAGAITNLGICFTTRDEAVAFKKLKEGQGWQKIILVTSALHLRRSEALFRKLGIEVIPVAADFEVLGVPQDSHFSPFPRQGRFRLLALYLHEKIGWWVYRVRGWV
jgi:uncharacterized SAM-binding protein YcdF (DUF218 family)